MSILLISRSTNVAREKHASTEREHRWSKHISEQSSNFFMRDQKGTSGLEKQLDSKNRSKAKSLHLKAHLLSCSSVPENQRKRICNLKSISLLLFYQYKQSCSLIKKICIFIKGVNHYKIKINFNSASYSQRKGSALTTVIAWSLIRTQNQKSEMQQIYFIFCVSCGID